MKSHARMAPRYRQSVFLGISMEPKWGSRMKNAAIAGRGTCVYYGRVQIEWATNRLVWGSVVYSFYK